MNEMITPGFQSENPRVAAKVKSLLVLGVGNTLLSDDGVGPKVIETLQCRDSSGGQVEYIDGGTLSFTLLDTIERHDRLIVVDACELGRDAGAIAVFKGADMDVHMRSGRRSVHEVALADLLDMARLRGCLPQRRALVGVQPDDLGWGFELSAPLAGMFDELCHQVEQLIMEWRP